jgi:hypothetical protein
MSSLRHPRRFQHEIQLDSVRLLLGWTTPELVGKIWAGKVPLRDLAAGEFVLFNSYAMCELVPPISSFFLLLLEEFGLQLQHLTPQSTLLVAVFAHFMKMFVGVRPCTAIFRHFYALVGSGRSKREVGAYYFQLWQGTADSYTSAFSSTKCEDWHDGWVITKTDTNDRLELPMERPLSDRSTWKAQPPLPAEIGPVLNRVKDLAKGGLTSLMVLGDFLRRHIAPLQQQSRMACMYTGPNDCCSIARGPGTDFTRAELEVAIRGMTGEAFSLESLVLSSEIKALCEDQALRSAVLASMPILDEGGLVVRQVGGDPNRGIHIPGASPDHQQRTSQGPGRSSHGGPAPGGRGKGKEPESERRHSKVWTAPRPEEMMRRGEQLPPGAARRRGPGPGGSSAVTAPTWGSRPPSARRRRRRRGRAALGLRRLRRNSSHRKRSHRRRQRRGAQRCRHHHHQS